MLPLAGQRLRLTQNSVNWSSVASTVGELVDGGARRPPSPARRMNSASVTQRHAEFGGLVAPALFGRGLVADDQRRVRVDRVGVGQAGMQDPLDEFLVGAAHLGGQRHPHALHQRPPADEPAGVDIAARQSRRQHLQRPQLVVGDPAVGPGRAASPGAPAATPCAPGRGPAGLEDLGEHQGVVERVMRAGSA